MEEEWQNEQKGTRSGQRQYSFANSGPMNVDFEQMKTYWGTSEPMPDPDPMSFYVKREDLK